jgi:hypothetical protein
MSSEINWQVASARAQELLWLERSQVNGRGRLRRPPVRRRQAARRAGRA